MNEHENVRARSHRRRFGRPGRPARDRPSRLGVQRYAAAAGSVFPVGPGQDQKDALQQVGKDVDAKVAAVDDAKRDFLKSLADEIDSGNVDASTLHPQIQKVVDAAVAASPDLRKAFDKLHDILDPSQRQQFVDAFRQVIKNHTSDVDPKQQLDKWAKALNLTDEQKQKIGSILDEDRVDEKVEKDRMDLVLDAFTGDTFSMDDLLPESSVGPRTERMLDKIVDVAKQVTAVLTPDQRKTAAQAIRDRASGAGAEGGGAQAGTGTTTGGTASAPASRAEAVGSTSQAIWAGGRVGYRGGYAGGVGYAGGYRVSSGYGFGGGWGYGYGGAYLF